MPRTDRRDPELCVILPSYNEAEIIESVIEGWCGELERLEIEYEIRIYDAASTDGTVEILRSIAQRNPRIHTIVEKRLPHGSACLRGYTEATADWVFQTDSDNEMGPGAFEELWSERHEYDLLLGCRMGRVSTIPRCLVTKVSRLSVTLLFGTGIRDVNTPYRLMRRSTLREIIEGVREDTVAPNVIISGLMRRMNKRIYQCDVPHQSRAEGSAGLVGLRLIWLASRCFIQTVAAAVRR